MSAQVKENKCSECKITFKAIYDLRKHVKKRHPDKLELIAPLHKKDLPFKCSQCHRMFSHESNFKYHMKKEHGANYYSNQKTHLKCVLCEDYTAKSKKDFYSHSKNTHNIPIESETIVFDNYNEFIKWKSNLEITLKASFIKERGSKPKTTDYICHRSGFFRSESKGQRFLKKQGSNKINGFCPAAIKLISEDLGKYRVEFIKTHVGHQMELSHLFLTSSERELIATKIASRIPFDEILNETRGEPGADSPLGRMQCLTKKDLLNIRASKKIETVLEQMSHSLSDDNITLGEQTLQSTELETETEERESIATKIASRIPFDLIKDDIRSIRGGLHLKKIETVLELMGRSLSDDNITLGEQTLQSTELETETEKRESIATKISSRIPFDEILNETQDEPGADSPLGRMQYLTKGEIRSIRASLHSKKIETVLELMGRSTSREQTLQSTDSGLETETVFEQITCPFNDDNIILYEPTLQSTEMETEKILEPISDPSYDSILYLSEHSPNNQTLSEQKEEIKRKFNIIIDSIRNETELEAIKKLVEPTLLATVRLELSKISSKQQVNDSNKKISQQRRIFILKKRRKKIAQ